jgi:hypothetical protein
MLKTNDPICYQHTESLPSKSIYITYYNSPDAIVGVKINQFGRLIWLTAKDDLKHRYSKS